MFVFVCCVCRSVVTTGAFQLQYDVFESLRLLCESLADRTRAVASNLKFKRLQETMRPQLALQEQKMFALRREVRAAFYCFVAAR